MTKMRRERFLKAKTTMATTVNLPQDNRRSVDETNITSTVISMFQLDLHALSPLFKLVCPIPI